MYHTFARLLLWIVATLMDNPRIALYSHDRMGLGHVRRNIAIAQILLQAIPRATVLLTVGTKEAAALKMPPGVEVVCLPAYQKGLDGTYRSRWDGVRFDELANLRGRVLFSALDSFRPDILIVDKVAGGAFGELRYSLEQLTRRHGTRLVLGLRDILDARDAAERDWSRDGQSDLIREYYHDIWLFGDRSAFDAVEEYPFLEEFRDRIRYLGYIDRSRLGEFQAPVETDGSVLCLVGGGQDGNALAEAFVEARIPRDRQGVLVTGPYMDKRLVEWLRESARLRGNVEVHEFVPDTTALLMRADRVIAMGGYNTVCEVLSFRKKALIVPRVVPRTEQRIRAERLGGRGLFDVLLPDQLSPQAIERWLNASPKEGRSRPVSLRAAEGIRAESQRLLHRSFANATLRLA